MVIEQITPKKARVFVEGREVSSVEADILRVVQAGQCAVLDEACLMDVINPITTQAWADDFMDRTGLVFSTGFDTDTQQDEVWIRKTR